MTRYLVVAHQTATEAHLIRRVRSGESEAIAHRRGEIARAALENAGVTVPDVLVGDELPISAIEDELRAHPDAYDSIILCTLPPGRSRWVEMYSHNRAEQRFTLPITPAYDGAEQVMRDGCAPPPVEREPLVRRVLNWLTEPRPGSAGRAPGRGYVVLVVLMLAYLGASATLALTVNQRFFANDALAVVVFGALLATRELA